MKKIIALIALLGAATAFADTSFGSDSYLYWMINASGSYADWTYAKIRVAGGDYLGINYAGVTDLTIQQTPSGYDHDFNLWSSLAGIDNTGSMIVELYNDSGCFAESDALSLSSAAQYIQTSRMSTPSAYAFTGFHIPEPNSAMLMLIGAALLGLKRKRAKKA